MSLSLLVTKKLLIFVYAENVEIFKIFENFEIFQYNADQAKKLMVLKIMSLSLLVTKKLLIFCIC